MHSLSRLCQRYEYFVQGPLGPLPQALAASLSRVTKPLADAGLLPEALLAAVESDLLYALARHRHWSRAPVFAEVLKDFLATGYRLERRLAASIVDAALAVIRALDRTATHAHVPPTDAEFLRFVCVAAALSPAADSLEAELGLGKGLLRRVHSALLSLAASGSPAVASLPTDGAEHLGTVTFLPIVDATIADIVVALREELRREPMALWIHQLRYLVIGMPSPWRELLEDHGTGWLFQLLVTMGDLGFAPELSGSRLPRGITATATAQVLSTLMPEEPPFADVAAAALLRHLVDFELIAAPTSARGGARRVDAPRFLLTPQGEQLVADALVRSLPRDWERLAAMSAAYQCAAVRDQHDVATLTDLFTDKAAPLKPAAMAAALGQLARRSSPAQAAATATQWLAGKDSPWQVQAALEALAQVPVRLALGPVLTSVAQSTESPMLRTSALRAAAHHGCPEASVTFLQTAEDHCRDRPD